MDLPPPRWTSRCVLLACLALTVSFVFDVCGTSALAQTDAARSQPANPKAADNAPVRFAEIAIGFGARGADGATVERGILSGHYKLGLWTPVNITLEAAAGASVSGVIELESIDGDGFANVVTSDLVTIPAGGQARRQLLLRAGSQGGSIKLRFRSADDAAPLAEKSADLSAMLSSQELWVEVGANIRLIDAARTHEVADTAKIEVAQVRDLEELPTHWHGYEGVDVLVVSPADPGFRDRLRGNARVEALERWVAAGGRLVIVAGADSLRNASMTSTTDPHPLARFLPGELQSQEETLRQLEEVQVLANTSDRLDINSLPLPVFANVPRERIRTTVQGGIPIRYEYNYKFGRVTCVPFDLDQPPFSNWGARGRFINWILGLPVGGLSRSNDETGGQLSHSGLTDISAQLRSGLDVYPAVSIIPFWVIALSILGYIILIGPLDYWLVKRGFFLRKKSDAAPRMEFTWITLPIWVILVSGVAWWAASSSKGSNLHINELTMEDHDLSGDFVRSSSWFGIFSPAMEAYDVSLAGAQPANDGSVQAPMVSWLGLPGRVLGGMATENTNIIGRAAAWNYGEDYASLAATPVPVWSSRIFTARWLRQPQSAPLEVAVRSSVAGDASGTIKNTSGHVLVNCLFAYKRWAFLIPRMEAGETISLSAVEVRRELRAELNNTRTTYSEQSKQMQEKFEAYDVLDRDVPQIARMMTFFDAAGGVGYTGLEDRYQQYVDLSEQVELGRGVFIGFVEDAQPEISITATGSRFEPHRITWKCLRCVFDVPPRDTSPCP